jgi:hypothetical protein
LIAFVFALYNVTSSYIRNWCISMSFILSWYSSLLRGYSNMKLETRDGKASLCLRPFWMGNLSVIYRSLVFCGLHLKRFQLSRLV